MTNFSHLHLGAASEAEEEEQMRLHENEQEHSTYQASGALRDHPEVSERLNLAAVDHLAQV